MPANGVDLSLLSHGQLIDYDLLSPATMSEKGRFASLMDTTFGPNISTTQLMILSEVLERGASTDS